MTPDDVSGARFRSSLRGYDPNEVKVFLNRVAERLGELRSERDQLARQLSEAGTRDLTSEFERVSDDIGRILLEANRAAEGLRRTASADAERWRSQATEDSEQIRRDAQQDAETMRSDAWTTASDLLKQSEQGAVRSQEAADHDALAILGEAEREAHRVLSGARREAEDSVRVAKMEADRLGVDARGRHDDLIEEARKEAEAAQERARALEVRRSELLAELESVRATIQRLEREVEERQEVTEDEFAEQSTVRVVPVGGEMTLPDDGTQEAPTADRATAAAEDPAAGSEAGVRIVPAPPRPRAPTPMRTQPVDATEMANEVRRLREAAEEPEEAGATQGAEEPEIRRAASTEVDRLFDALRSDAGGQPAQPSPNATPNAEERVVETTVTTLTAVSADDVAAALDEKERLLLPIINAALRGVKRQITEAQNTALDELRRDGDWVPATADLVSLFKSDLSGLVESAFSVGAVAGSHRTGVEAAALSTAADPTPRFAGALGAAVEHALDEGRGSGQGPRQLSATVSRVYRSWRTDEAERSIGSYASGAYHEGLVASYKNGQIEAVQWGLSGRGCPECRAARESGVIQLADEFASPPAHADCGCTLVPA